MQKITASLIISLAVVLFFLPAVIFGSGGADLIYHLLWGESFASQLWQGDVYPRILMDMNAGCGYPAFYYYPPLSYYLSAAFYFLNDFAPKGWLPLVGAAFVATAAGAFFCYRLVLEISQRKHIALVVALLFIWLPYRVYSFYSLFLFSEFIALSWGMMLLYGTFRLGQKRPYGISISALAVGLLLLTNIPASLLLIPLAACFALFYAWQQKCFAIIGKLALAYMLGILLAAVYVLPMWQQLPDANVGASRTMWEGMLYFGNGFLFDWRESTLPYKLETRIILSGINFIMLALAIFGWKRARNASKPSIYAPHFWLLIAILSFFMMLPLSEFMWEALPLLQVIQFPWRLSSVLLIATLMLLVLAANASQKTTNSPSLAWPIMMGLFLILPFFISFSYGSRGVFEAVQYHSIRPAGAYEKQVGAYHALNTPWSQEYLSPNVDLSLFKAGKLPELAKICSQKLRVLKGDAKTTLTHWGGNSIIFEVNASTQSTIEIGQFYYPTWHAGDYPITPAPKTGLMQIDVPAGKHQITLAIKPSQPEQYGKLLSLLGLVILLLSAGHECYRTQNKRKLNHR